MAALGFNRVNLFNDHIEIAGECPIRDIEILRHLLNRNQTLFREQRNVNDKK
jgi:hypothetical protein